MGAFKGNLCFVVKLVFLSSFSIFCLVCLLVAMMRILGKLFCRHFCMLAGISDFVCCYFDGYFLVFLFCCEVYCFVVSCWFFYGYLVAFLLVFLFIFVFPVFVFGSSLMQLLSGRAGCFREELFATLG